VIGPALSLAALVPADRLPLPVDDLAVHLARAVEEAGFVGGLSVAIVDDETMRQVNRDFHACDEPTDVLAFPLGDPAGLDHPGAGLSDTGLAESGAAPSGYAAEVVVSLDTALREAERRGVAPLAELTLYVVHGTLHLLGFDDVAADDARRMHLRTLEVLESLGLRNEIAGTTCADDDAG